jgi:hypothetical protein
MIKNIKERCKQATEKGAKDFLGKMALKVYDCKVKYKVKNCSECRDQDICFKKRFEVVLK